MITWDEYKRIPAVNISLLLHMAKSAAHYRYVQEHGSEDTPALGFGRLAHLAILEPDRYEEVVAVWTGEGDRRTKAYKEWASAQTAEYLISEAEHEQCMAMANAVREHRVAGGYLASKEAMTEVTLQWKHPIGLDLKGRVDWVDVANHVIVDLKTARDASELEFGKAAARHHYATRAAYYSDGYQARFGTLPSFVLIAVEKAPPYAPAVYRVPAEAIESGRREYERLLGRLKHCLDTDCWPGLCDDKEIELQLPAWAFGDDDGLDLDFGDEGVLRV